MGILISIHSLLTCIPTHTFIPFHLRPLLSVHFTTPTSLATITAVAPLRLVRVLALAGPVAAKAPTATDAPDPIPAGPVAAAAAAAAETGLVLRPALPIEWRRLVFQYL